MLEQMLLLVKETSRTARDVGRLHAIDPGAKETLLLAEQNSAG